MNTGNNRKNARVVYREYTDSDGNIRTEYKDAKGNIYTEYQDANGTFHTDEQNSINHKLADARIQDARVDNAVAQIDRSDKNISKGLLIGVIVTTVAGLVAGVIYFLNDLNNPQPVPIVTIPTEKVNPNPTPIKVVEKEVVKIVPVQVPVPTPMPTVKAPEAKAPETKTPEAKAPETKTPEPNNNPTVNNNITVKPSESNSVPVAKPSETTTKPVVIPNNSVKGKNDTVLKNEILKTFQGNLPNNQLKVEVKNGEVIVSGNVETQEQMQQIEPLLSSIEGIKKVNVMASIEPRVTN
ncbi:BON domain-containing protein [Geminocystis herdmanii]|uniref:BON domain-containing protein n=1 Tax=Geminocystis herdmanii TaxID=669359 RepID=UPI00034982C8|nr:BON domain-containing protein [Geminocystis herdmanii]